MSRIGKKPVIIPANVTVTIADGNVVTVKGPKGTLTHTFHPDMILKIGQPKLESPKKQIPLRLAQMVIDRFRALGPGWQAATCWPTPGSPCRPTRPVSSDFPDPARGSADRGNAPGRASPPAHDSVIRKAGNWVLSGAKL